MPVERFMEKLTWAELAERMQAGVDAVLLPIGTTEQHGRHMPLDTDCVIARALCEQAAEAAAGADLEVLIAPTLNVTLSWYHMQFPGSLRLKTDTFLRVFEEVCESLHHHGLDNVIAVNGHGGNVAALTVAVNRYYEVTRRRVFLLQWWELAGEAVANIEGPLIHAEEAETSLAMALGQRVMMEHASRDAYDRGGAVKEAGFPWTSLGKYGLTHRGPGVVVPMDMLGEISDSGVIGDATRARLETGQAIVDAVIPRIVQVVRDM
ncbi:MAG: creatininase family protein, partial [Solirubrobacterales bacterium]|nr:creatininase family protein [Solirubrobacterales bacterium]